MADSNHKLLLGMFSFQMKKKNTRGKEVIDINDFLSQSYPDREKKFSEGFAQEIIDLIDEKTFKNKSNTHGGVLEDYHISNEKRYFDIVIDGGLTGIQQFLVDEDGNKQTITRDKVVGLKFFARFWLPAGGKTGYMFIQRYGSSTLKPLFDELIRVVLDNHEFRISGTNRMKPITTKKRLKKFLSTSAIRDVTVISKNSNHDTGSGDAQSVTIKLKNIVVKSSDNQISREVVSDAMRNHGFTLGEKEYEMTATYESRVDGKKEEEKTTKLDASEDSINIIPNILLPYKCIDKDGYPKFEVMRSFVDEEISQIKEESKK